MIGNLALHARLPRVLSTRLVPLSKAVDMVPLIRVKNGRVSPRTPGLGWRGSVRARLIQRKNTPGEAPSMGP